MRATIKRIAAITIITTAALTMAACDDIDGGAIQWDGPTHTETIRQQQRDSIPAPTTEPTPNTWDTEAADLHHQNWQRGNSSVDLSEIYERNGYNK